MFKKIVSLTLCLLLALWMPVGAWAGGPTSGGSDEVTITFKITNGSWPLNHGLTLETDGSCKKTVAKGGNFQSLSFSVDPVPDDSGKEFSGWTIENGDGTIVGNTTTFAADTTLVPVWKDRYTIHYDPNDGTGSMTDGIATADTPFTLPVCTFTAPTGKAFDKWAIGSASSTTTVAEGGTHTFTADTTVYATWKDKVVPPTTYKITFNSNNGTSSTTFEKTATDGKDFEFPPNSFTAPNGKVFAGWSTNPSATSGLINPDHKMKMTQEATYYAIWKDASTFTVTLDPNSGNFTGGAQGKLTVKEGESVKLEPAPTRPGYDFAGWYTAATGGNKVGDLADSYIPKANITLYAQWNKKTYNIQFELNGGEWPSSTTIQATVSEKYPTLPDGTQVKHKGKDGKEDYTFAGWATEKFGGTLVKTGDTVLPPKTVNETVITLYARWSGIKVTFELGGDYASMPNTDKVREVTCGSTYGAAKNLPTPTRVGYTFLGWYLDDKFETKVENNTVVEKAEDHALYAKWTTGGFKVKLDPNGGKVTPTEMTFDYSGQYVGLPTPTLDGYEFDGWYTQATGGTKVTATDKVNAEHKTLYAHWTAKGNVKLDPNGGKFPEGTHTTIKAEAGGTYPAYPTNLTREGYDFKGWTTTKDDINTLIQVGGPVSSPAPTTLYALWSGKTYKVTYDFNGGASDPITRNVIFGQKYTSLPSAHRGGYTFIGWFTAATGGTAVTTDTTVSTASDHTLYAHWGFNVEFNANGGTGNMDPMKVTAGESVTLPACSFTPPYDKVFSHWAIGSAMGEEITGSSHTFNANTTLYAIWKDAPLTITAKASEGGSISPSGSVSVDRGKDQTFRITARDGYRITEVLVDGRSYGPIESHVFRNVEEDHTIEAIFTAVSAPGYINCDKGLECPLAKFSDLDPNAWYHDAIHYCMDNVLMTGTSKTKYNQSQRTDRATLAEILWRSEGCPNPVGAGSLNQPYKDVPPTKWFYKSVTWASRNNIVSGYGNGNFGPSDLITREQVATILWRHAGSPELTDVRMPYYDAYEISDFAWEAMCWATQRGILKGKGEGILDPKGYATRAEIAQMMMNYLK